MANCEFHSSSLFKAEVDKEKHRFSSFSMMRIILNNTLIFSFTTLQKVLAGKFISSCLVAAKRQVLTRLSCANFLLFFRRKESLNSVVAASRTGCGRSNRSQRFRILQCTDSTCSLREAREENCKSHLEHLKWTSRCCRRRKLS